MFVFFPHRIRLLKFGPSESHPHRTLVSAVFVNRSARSRFDRSLKVCVDTIAQGGEQPGFPLHLVYKEGMLRIAPADQVSD